MQQYFFNPHAVPVFTVGLIIAIGGFFAYLRNVRSIVNSSYFLICLSAGTWLIATALGYISVMPAKASLWFKCDNAGVMFISVSIFFFTKSVLGLKGRKSIYFGYLLAFVLALIGIQTNLLVTGVTRHYWGFFPKWGILSIPVLALFFSYMGASFIVLFYQYLKGDLSNLKKNQVKYIIIGYSIGYLGSVDFLPTLGIEIYPFGYIVVLCYLGIIAYAVVKYHLIDVRLAVTRASIFTFVYMFVLGIPFAVGWLGSNEISKWLGSKWWLFPTGLMFLLASLGPLIYSRLKHQAEEALLKEQRRYQQTLLRASQGMTFIKELDRLLKLIVHVLTKTIGLEYAAIYIYDKSSSKFQLKAKRGNSFDGFTVIEPRNPLLPFALYHKKAITFETIDEFTANQTKFDADTLKKEMKALSASVLVPSIVENHLLGFSILGEKLSHKPYTEDDLDAFTILANHASLAIENALFYEEAGKTMAEKFHEHRLWSIGRMGSGVGHQINNRFNVISVRSDATRLIEVEKLKKTNLTKDQKQLVDAIESTFVSLTDEAMRGGEIATTLTTFSRKTSDYTDIAFNDVVKGAANLLSCKFNLNELGLVQNYGEFSQKIYGNLSQLQDVFVNLLDNTRDAINKRIEEETAGNIKPKIPNQPPMTEVNAHIEGNKWHIVLQDNGIGMTPDEQKQLFVPFFTTKATAKKGTGLGLSIIKQIIEAHNGTITIDSVYGEGTTFNITLPVYDAQAKKS